MPSLTNEFNKEEGAVKTTVWLSTQRCVQLVSSEWLKIELIKDHHDKNTPSKTEADGLH